MIDWQPIETAPKDESIIWGKLSNGHEREMKWAGGGWAMEWAGRKAWLVLNKSNQPICWMQTSRTNYKPPKMENE